MGPILKGQEVLLFLDFLTLEGGTNTLSRNIGKGLPLDSVLHRRRAQISSASWQKPEITDIIIISLIQISLPLPSLNLVGKTHNSESLFVMSVHQSS
jgi:hypothetical protein